MSSQRNRDLIFRDWCGGALDARAAGSALLVAFVTILRIPGMRIISTLN